MLDLSFTNEQLKTFDNALDLLSERGYHNEIKHLPETVIGDTVITYSVVRVSPEVSSPKFGDIMVLLTYQGGRSGVTFYKPAPGGKEEIPASEIVKLPKVS